MIIVSGVSNQGVYLFGADGFSSWSRNCSILHLHLILSFFYASFLVLSWTSFDFSHDTKAMFLENRLKCLSLSRYLSALGSKCCIFLSYSWFLLPVCNP